MNLFFYLSTILMGLLISSNDSQANNEKLDVGIYYEALCPYCIEYFVNQLAPNYDAFKDYINIIFVPFGNAHSLKNTSDGVKFVCQHGEDECKENMIQACTLFYLKDLPDEQMKYTVCQMKSSDRIGERCAKLVNVPFKDVSNCMVNGLGIKLQLEMERETNAVPDYRGTPTVTINKANHGEASNDFKSAICKSLNNKPKACKNWKLWQN